MSDAPSAASRPRPVPREAKAGAAIFIGRIGFGLTSAALLLLWLAWDELGSPFGPGMAAVLAYVLFAFHLLLVRGRISPFDPVLWVPISMLLFYFGLPVAVEIFDSPLGYDAFSLGVPENLDEGFCAVLLAFVSFLWGIHLAGLVDLSRPLPPGSARDRSAALPGVIQTIGALLMIGFGVILVGPSVVFSTYGEWNDAKLTGADPRFIDAGVCFAVGGIYALLASDDPRRQWRRWLAYGAAAAIAFVTINKGDRTGLIALCVGSGWCYSQRIRRVPPSVVAALAAFALLLMPVLQEYREWKSVETSREKTVTLLASEAFSTMGSSVLTMVYTEDLVPRVRGYAFGITYLDSVILLVPNFGLTPGRRWGFDPYQNQPALWLVYQLSPEWAAEGGGYGFSMVGEWYWNFGPLGVWLGTALWGWLTTRFRNASQRSSMMLVLSALCFAAMTIHVRNTIGFPLRFAVWSAVGLWVFLRLARALARPQPVSLAEPDGQGAASGMDAAARGRADAHP